MFLSAAIIIVFTSLALHTTASSNLVAVPGEPVNVWVEGIPKLSAIQVITEENFYVNFEKAEKSLTRNFRQLKNVPAMVANKDSELYKEIHLILDNILFTKLQNLMTNLRILRDAVAGQGAPVPLDADCSVVHTAPALGRRGILLASDVETITSAAKKAGNTANAETDEATKDTAHQKTLVIIKEEAETWTTSLTVLSNEFSDFLQLIENLSNTVVSDNLMQELLQGECVDILTKDKVTIRECTHNNRGITCLLHILNLKQIKEAYALIPIPFYDAQQNQVKSIFFQNKYIDLEAQQVLNDKDCTRTEEALVCKENGWKIDPCLVSVNSKNPEAIDANCEVKFQKPQKVLVESTSKGLLIAPRSELNVFLNWIKEGGSEHLIVTQPILLRGSGKAEITYEGMHFTKTLEGLGTEGNPELLRIEFNTTWLMGSDNEEAFLDSDMIEILQLTLALGSILISLCTIPCGLRLIRDIWRKRRDAQRSRSRERGREGEGSPEEREVIHLLLDTFRRHIHPGHQIEVV